HHVGGIAHAPLEQLGVLKHWGAHLAKAVELRLAAEDVLHHLPFFRFPRDDVHRPLGCFCNEFHTVSCLLSPSAWAVLSRYWAAAPPRHQIPSSSFLKERSKDQRDAGPLSRTAALAAGILASGKQRRPRVPLPGFLPRAGRKLMALCPRFLTVTERCCRNSPPAG